MLSLVNRVVILVLVVGYTGLLVTAAAHRSRGDGEAQSSAGFVHGGRQFSAWQVFAMVSALWCSSILVVEMETGYLLGVSALWFGLGTVLMALVTGYLVPTFRRLGYLTSSGVIGARFGSSARVLSGLVIGVTFPVFAMSNVLGAAGFLHRILGWPLPVTLVVGVVVILAYVCVGGMRALARAQVANLVVMTIGLAGAVGWALHATSPGRILAGVPPTLRTPGGAGAALIITWVVAGLLNVVNAQAEFQILTAARDSRAARRGLHAALALTALFTLGAVTVGMAARSVAHGDRLGVVAIPALFGRAPLLLLALVSLAVWASALSWSAPLMLSGASSLGADVLAPLLARTARWGRAGAARYVRAALPVQALLIVGFALLRPADLAWWRIFGQTVRTGALFAVTIAVLALPRVRKAAAVASILVGALGGLGWNVLTGFSTHHFAGGINPMWIGASAGVVVIAGGILLDARGRLAVLRGREAAGLAVALGLTVLALAAWPAALHRAGLTGPALLVGAAILLALGWLVQRESLPAPPSAGPLPADQEAASAASRSSTPLAEVARQ